MITNTNSNSNSNSDLQPTQPTRPTRRIDDLPGPRGWPFFGNAFQVSVPRIHLDMEQWVRQFGPLFKVRLLNRQVLVVADHALVSAASHRPRH